jgi:Cu-Zn family superoxide dismutase
MTTLLFALVAGLAWADKGGKASAELQDAQGRKVGTATFKEGKDGVKLSLKVSSEALKEGKHGFHIHAVGKCEGPDFKSAGGHFNPGSKKHGKENPEGAHAGDLANLDIDGKGKGKIDTTVEGVTLKEGPNSLLGPEGTAVVIHADPDDGMTDPAGNAGARIACGVIKKG